MTTKEPEMPRERIDLERAIKDADAILDGPTRLVVSRIVEMLRGVAAADRRYQRAVENGCNDLDRCFDPGCEAGREVRAAYAEREGWLREIRVHTC